MKLLLNPAVPIWDFLNRLILIFTMICIAANFLWIKYYLAEIWEITMVQNLLEVDLIDILDYLLI